MNRADADNLAAGAGAAVAVLPWQWFEFREMPRVLRGNGELGVATEAAEVAAERVFQVEVDGHPVPFKFFRKPCDYVRPVLVMLHGMGLTIASFRGISGYLSETHDLILPDYSGFSLPFAPLPLDASFNTFSTAVWRIADALGIETIDLAGNSLGGGLCLLTTLFAPERVRRIALANPACFPQILPSMYRLVRVPLVGEVFMTVAPPEKFVGGIEYIGYVDKSRFDPVLRNAYIGSLANRRTRMRLMQIMRELPAGPGDVAGHRHLKLLNTITQPVLISWGSRDPLLTEGAGERLAAALPNSIYEVYGELAHMPHEEAPDVIGRRWAAFFNA